MIDTAALLIKLKILEIHVLEGQCYDNYWFFNFVASGGLNSHNSPIEQWTHDTSNIVFFNWDNPS